MHPGHRHLSASDLNASLYAVAPPGLEAVVADEVRALGFADVESVRGGTAFTGHPLVANRGLRCATRVLQRVATFKARDFEALQRGASAVDWTPFGGGTPRAVCRKSRLYHSGAVEERLAAVIPPGPAEILARIDRDRCTLSIDTSGAPLHKRGWRLETGAAPLRETLACGILALAGWAPGEALYDPMCGSGTFVIEAARHAAGIAPGADRAFACAAWCVPPPGGPAGHPVAAVPTVIAGSDRAAPAVKAARRNAERAGVDITLEVVEVGRATPPTEAAHAGLVVCNPPYGKRIAAAQHAFDRLAAALAGPFSGWRAAILSPEPGLLDRLGRAESARHTLRNGGLRIHVSVLGPA